MDWVADHRKHHAHADEEGDPHSPHVGHGSGLQGPLARPHRLADGDARAWRTGRSTPRELYEDPGMRRIGRHVPVAGASPASRSRRCSASCCTASPLEGALRGLVWGGLVRAFFLHHVTWSINSICHFFGRRRFDIEDRSTNVAWLAIPSMGEAWHHNHHAFPRSAAHGLERWEVDPSALVIRAMEKVGLAWNVVRIAPERQAHEAGRRQAARPAPAPPSASPPASAS